MIGAAARIILFCCSPVASLFKSNITINKERSIIDIEAKLSSELGVEKWQVTAAVQLIDEDNTIPFIARYRKEKTGALNDEILRKLYERLIYLRNLEDKKQQVIATIRDQGKITD